MKCRDGVGIYIYTNEFNLQMINRSFAASYSRGTKPPFWRGVALKKDKQRKLPFNIMYAFCLSCPSATFVLQHGGFVPLYVASWKGPIHQRYQRIVGREMGERGGGGGEVVS